MPGGIVFLSRSTLFKAGLPGNKLLFPADLFYFQILFLKKYKRGIDNIMIVFYSVLIQQVHYRTLRRVLWKL